MFHDFRAAYATRRDPSKEGGVWRAKRLSDVDGYEGFAREFAGASFGRGLYRVHDDHTGPRALALVSESFPEFARRACPFGYDWLGRQFAVDSERTLDGQDQVLLLEPGTGEALEIPASFATFHDVELVKHADAALAPDFFDAWADANAAAMPLRRDQCVGYQVPLFLGGQDTVENLIVSDIDVYWSLTGQLRRKVLKHS